MLIPALGGKTFLMKILLTLFLTLHIMVAKSHPAWGIAIASDGTIWVADLMHHHGSVWKLTPKGQLVTVLKNVHVHTLHAGSKGKVWVGELEDYNNTYSSKLWQLTTNSNKVVHQTKAEVSWGSTFAIDEEDNLYYVSGETIVVRKPSGSVKIFATHSFQRLATMMVHGNSLYVSDNNANNGSIYQYDLRTGKLVQTYSQLFLPSPTNPPFPEPHTNILMGMAVDNNGTLYACNTGSRSVWKFEGHKKIVCYQSEHPWYPVGIVFRKGIPVVLEVGYTTKHLGPRLVEWRNNTKTILFNTDAP